MVPTKFTTYAYLKIKGSIEHFLRDRAHTISIPHHIQELLSRIRREEERLTQTLGYRPSLSEIAISLGVKNEQVVRALDSLSTREILPLDAPVPGTNSEGLRLSEVIPDPASLEKAERSIELLDLDWAVSQLNDLQRRA